ncbi:hypothetical protein TYM08_P3884 [Marinicellulosiphila megalodicopiae]
MNLDVSNNISTVIISKCGGADQQPCNPNGGSPFLFTAYSRVTSLIFTGRNSAPINVSVWLQRSKLFMGALLRIELIRPVLRILRREIRSRHHILSAFIFDSITFPTLPPLRFSIENTGVNPLCKNGSAHYAN